MNALARNLTSVVLILVSASAVGAGEPRRSAPLLVAHRGLLLHSPENTLANFRACLELRIGFELDVRRSELAEAYLGVVVDLLGQRRGFGGRCEQDDPCGIPDLRETRCRNRPLAGRVPGVPIDGVRSAVQRISAQEDRVQTVGRTFADASGQRGRRRRGREEVSEVLCGLRLGLLFPRIFISC